MATWVKDVAEDWGVFSVLEHLGTDSASNMHAMMKFLPTYIRHGDCTIHVMQLAIMVRQCKIIKFNNTFYKYKNVNFDKEECNFIGLFGVLIFWIFM